ncbi:MAG: lipid-A-disaccharide synthase [Alphaproteobacteria bacterium]|nr:lipid-A-disaccharide synthase [Alphaproteobacteria bacterium]
MNCYLIAGEASGDALGARLMAALRALAPEPVAFAGIGGDAMAESGLEASLFPMQELSLMGIAEVAPKILAITRRIEETVADILERKPDVLVTIDAPDFCFRVARAVRERASSRPVMIHYVAPTVWAWRPGRAKKVAEFLDGILCLLPFEPPYFEREGLSAAFVGHSVIETGILDADPARFRAARGIPDGAPVLGVMPGSRAGEIRRTGAVLFEAAQAVLAANPGMHVVVPTLPHLVRDIHALWPGSSGTVHITNAPAPAKWDAFAACDVAMATSGTVGLELAICGVPHLIGYRMNRVTWELVRRAVRVRHAHLANIMLDRELVSEFIQDRCTAKAMAQKIRELLSSPELRKAQSLSFETVREKIGADESVSPSVKAARFVLEKTYSP